MNNSLFTEKPSINMGFGAYKSKLRRSTRSQNTLSNCQVKEEPEPCSLRDQEVESYGQMSDSITYNPLISTSNSKSVLNNLENSSQEIKIENEPFDKTMKLESELMVPIKTEDNSTKQTSFSPVPVSEEEKDVMKPEKEAPKPRRNKKKYHHKPRNYWLDSEDEKLLEMIDEVGEKWSKIAAVLKGRTGKQIRDRYINYLRPNIKQKEWTKEEDDLLTELFDEYGNKWSKIAAYLPGRTENQVKNRFYAAARKEKRREEKRKRLAKNDPDLVKFVKLDSEVNKSIALPVKNDLPINIPTINAGNVMSDQTYNFRNYLTQFPTFSFNNNMINQNNFFGNPMSFNTNILQAYAKLDKYNYMPPMQEQRFDQVSTFSTHLSSRGESPAATHMFTEEGSPLSPGALRARYHNQEYNKYPFVNGKYFDIKTEAL